MVRTGNDNLVLRLDALDLQKRLFDLRRKDQYAAYLKHVVAASRNAVHPYHRSSALAVLSSQSGNVPGAEPQHRHTLSSQSGKHQLAALAVRKRFKCLRRYDLRVEMIFKYMQSVFPVAFMRHSGTDNLRKAINVQCHDMEPLFD